MTVPEVPEQFAEWIRTQRQAHGLSLEALAELVDAYPGEVIGWEHARCLPTQAQRTQLERVLGRVVPDRCDTATTKRTRSGSLLPPRAELAAKYLDEKRSIRQLAEDYGVSKQRMRRWLRDLGLPLRSRRGELVLCRSHVYAAVQGRLLPDEVLALRQRHPHHPELSTTRYDARGEVVRRGR